MSDYAAPLDDMRFVLEQSPTSPASLASPGYEHADPDTVAGLLDEAGRFFAEQFAPLNRVGDVQHSRRNDDGTVTTPDGFAKAYRRTSTPAGRPCRSPPSTAAAASRGSSARRCRR